MFAVIRRVYHIDPSELTYGTFLDYLNNVDKIRRWESGQSISEGIQPQVNAAKKLTAEEFAEALLAGEVKPEDLKPKIRKLTPDERKAEEARVKRALNMDTQRPIFDRIARAR
jgi:single-stranded DNA-specific DHH superfamily exonuclease